MLAGLCALFVARPLYASELAAAVWGDGLPMVMLWIILAVVWLLGAIGGERFTVRFGWTDAAVGLLVGLHTIAALWATVNGSPRPAVNMLWEWVALGLSFLMARQLIAGARETRAIIAVMIALGVALAGFGLYQYLYESPATRAMYDEYPDKMLRDAGMWYEPGSPGRQQFEDRLRSKEPTATFALANSFAGYLAPWLVMAAGIGIFAERNRQGSNRGPPLPTWLATAICAVPMAAALVLTKSRTGFLAAAFGLVLVWWFCWKRRLSSHELDHSRRCWNLGPVRLRIGWGLLGIFAAVAILIVVAGVTGGLDTLVLSETPKSLEYRAQYWRSSLEMIADYPLTGCGPGNFQHAYAMYKLPEASEEIADPHNFLFEVWATAGTPVMLALLGVLGGFGAVLFRHRRQLDSPSPISPGVNSEMDNNQDNQIDATNYILAGAAGGFLLSVPIGMTSSAPPGVAPLLIGLPLGAIAVALLWRWIDNGQLPYLLPAIGVIVLLVNLSAAGGIGFPAVAGTLWLLMAVGLNLAEGPPRRIMSRNVGLLALVGGILLAVACYASAYGPVLQCKAALERSRSQPLHAVEHLTEAAQADPLAVEPHKQLAQIELSIWLRSRDSKTREEAFGRFEEAISRAVELAPHSASVWRMRGDLYSDAFRATGHKDNVRKAVEAYRKAVEFYPNSGTHRAALAMALRDSRDQRGFLEQAKEALRLDDLTPHLDKKLDDDVRSELASSILRTSRRDG